MGVLYIMIKKQMILYNFKKSCDQYRALLLAVDTPLLSNEMPVSPSSCGQAPIPRKPIRHPFSPLLQVHFNLVSLFSDGAPCSFTLVIADSEQDMLWINPGRLHWHNSTLTTDLKEVSQEVGSEIPGCLQLLHVCSFWSDLWPKVCMFKHQTCQHISMQFTKLITPMRNEPMELMQERGSVEQCIYSTPEQIKTN